MGNKSLEKVFKCIDEGNDFCFNAGAGCGKTYSLVKTIEYVLDKKGKTFKDSNQKILVITYTNAAADEIIHRLGKSDLVAVSTIHDRLWKLVNKFQDDLISFHKENLEEKSAELQLKIIDSEYSSDEKLAHYIESDDEFESIFWKNYNLKAKDFKEFFNNYTQCQITNVGKFKEFVKNSLKLKKYKKCIYDIDEKKKIKVRYNPLINYDRIEKMEFSHDTLLKYSYKLYKKNKIAKRVFSELYPIVLVDEFQDTSEDVINILKLISNENKSTIGFYGDVFQNIYSHGIGAKLFEIFNNVISIDKVENRRSLKNVIDIANKLRTDGLIQKPYNSGIGINKIYYCNDQNKINTFIEQSINEIRSKDEKDSQICCLLLKNEMVASKQGFGQYYELLAKSDYYRQHYQQTATEILANDVINLGKIPLLIYKIIDFYMKLNQPNVLINEYIPKKIYQKYNYFHIKMMLEELQSISGDSLEELVDSLLSKMNKTSDIKKIIIEWFGEMNFHDLLSFKEYLQLSLFPNEKRIKEATNWIDSFCKLKVSELKKWYYYVNDIQNNNVIYKTLHSSKGKEFDNLIVVLTNQFNKSNTYFHDYFKNMNSMDNDNIIKRNLLYVAITRAKKNLYVLYVDQHYQEINEILYKIFGNDIAEFV